MIVIDLHCLIHYVQRFSIDICMTYRCPYLCENLLPLGL